MKVKLALALPDGLKVTGIEMIDEVLTITAVSAQMHPCCLLCGTPAERFHSRYTRQITDLPLQGNACVCLSRCVNAFVTWPSVPGKSLQNV